jgi:hypothetical protein
MKRTIAIEIESGENRLRIRKKIDRILLGGMSGRNPLEVKRHLRDLEQYGIPAPARIPMIMRVTVGLLTSAKAIEVQGEKTSGEAEYVFFEHDGRTIVTVGSDHSDNELEKTSSKRSKQAAPKVLCPFAWYYEDVRDHWDRLILRSWILLEGKRELYQEDALAALLRLEDLRRIMQERVGGPLQNALIFSGTLPTKGGIRHSDSFQIELEDPVLQRKLSHGYKVESLPGYY